MDHISTISPYDVRFMDECSFNCASGTCFYGSSEVGSRALQIAKHPVGPNYALFLMIGLNNKIFAYVSEGNSDSYTYIEFIHQAVLSNDIKMMNQCCTQGAALLLIMLPSTGDGHLTFLIHIWMVWI